MKLETPKTTFPIPEFPGYYLTKTGDVWSAKRRKWLNFQITNAGRTHSHVTLSHKNKLFNFTKGSLLLRTFVSLPKEGEICRHLNDVDTDNSLENLAWGTYSQNAADAIRNGRTLGFRGKQGHDVFTAKLFPLDVINIFHLYASGKTQIEIAKLYNMKQPQISSIVRGEAWKHVYKHLGIS